MRFLFAVMVLLVATAAVAQDCDLPAGAYEVETWKLINGTWVSDGMGPYPECATGRLWASGAVTGECNRRCWDIDVQIHASIAQWIWFNVTGTRWDWRILKPGTYGGDCITFQLCSNGPVAVNYEGFDNLYSPNACDQFIEAWYGIGGSIHEVERNGWVPARELNGHDDVIEEVCPGHCFTTKLWSKVQVDTCNTACEYHDDAQITLCLQNQKCWVDEDGSWWDLGPCID